MTTLPHDRLRRVAILVATLDTHSADLLLEQLSTEDATQLRHMMVELDTVDAGEEQSVIDDFFRSGLSDGDSLATPSLKEGVELCLSGDVPASETSQTIAPSPTLAVPSNREPMFSFLEHTGLDQLIQLLASERSQTIALVLSRLSEPRALAVLESLPEGLQCEILRRWVDLDDADPAALCEIERELQARHAPRGESPARRATGLAQVAGLVEAADAPLKRRLLTNLAANDDRLASKATAPRLAFEDLEYLNDLGLAALVRAADPQTTVLALADASETFVERVMRQLPGTEAKRLRRALRSLGPTRLADLEKAQHDLAALAETIVKRSKLMLSTLPLAASG